MTIDKGPSETKARILDSAESLFSKNGYKGTSLRQITSDAGVNLASVNYHFGSKLALLDEVIKRRTAPLNEIRKKRLMDIKELSERSGEVPDAAVIIKAFIEPTIRFMDSGQRARDFVALISRSFSDPDDTVRNIFHKYISPVFELFFEMMSMALPDLPGEVVFWRMNFALGSMLHTMIICGTKFKELDRFDTDTDTLIGYFMDFIMSGINGNGKK